VEECGEGRQFMARVCSALESERFEDLCKGLQILLRLTYLDSLLQ
jgi:hypothetical protein